MRKLLEISWREISSNVQIATGRLPTLKEVMHLILFRVDCNEVAWDLVCHWTICNVYTFTRQNIKVKIEKYRKELKKIRGHTKSKKNKTYWERLKCFVTELNTIFDIKGDIDGIKSAEQFWDVKFDWDFYKGRCSVPQEGYCNMKIDKKWEKNS